MEKVRMKKPHAGETKQEQYSTDAEHYAQDLLIGDGLLCPLFCTLGMSNKHHNHPDEENHIGHQDQKDGH